MPSRSESDLDVLHAALAIARAALLNARNAAGHWTGELSTSALSTATAVTALAFHARGQTPPAPAVTDLCQRGLKWLADHQNADGGWGDTTASLSNISTTALAWAAFGALRADERYHAVIHAAETWLMRKTGNLTPERLAGAITGRYGQDRTFSAPILTMCALAGRLGEGEAAWRLVRQLPFELAALPRGFYAAVRLPVVSYALPALIAIGQARHFHLPTVNPVTRLLRSLTAGPSLRLLAQIQPSNGGFLEATPLTSFVVMSLASMGHRDHVVTRRGVEFLQSSARPDGSWPIDTNLCVWLTTLAVNALGRECMEDLSKEERMSVRDWLLERQTRFPHPYTGARPGAWAWTDLPGGVPDADDTACALLALAHLGLVDSHVRSAADCGVEWLMGLQNRDGGIPTFCRGWGALPFDRSGPDLSAHALHALLVWRRQVTVYQRYRINDAIQRLIAYLTQTQRTDGSWLPLWFGNKFSPDETNPIYGTARVVTALAAGSERAHVRTRRPLLAGVEYLLRVQNNDGSWGWNGEGAGTVEETALAVQSLAAARDETPDDRAPKIARAVRRGALWLAEAMHTGGWTRPSPIGFYFAKLWYWEKLYPIIFTVGALERAKNCLATAGQQH